MKAYISDSILEMITEYATNERLDKIVMEKGRYNETLVKIEEQTKKFKSLNLTQEQKAVVDEFIESNNASGTCYAKEAYQQGFKDCALLLCEIGII